MKKTIITVAIIFLMAVGLTASGHGDNKNAKPLRDFLIQPHNSTWQTYGYSEETFRLYNIIAIMQLAQRNELQITSLRKEVAGLIQTVKNLEVLVEANALTITTLATVDMLEDIKAEFAEPNDLKDTQKEQDK